MTTFIVQRLLSLIPLVLAVALFSFVLIDAAPGDFLTEMRLTVPPTVALRKLRADLESLCNELNCDVDLEPAEG